MTTLSIRAEVVGGLGNQLFQIANGIFLSIKYGRPIEFVHRDLLRESHLNALGLEQGKFYVFSNSGSGILASVTDIETVDYKRLVVLTEKAFHFEPLQVPNEPFVIRGYFQSIKYFEDIATDIVAFFKLRLFANNQNESNDSSSLLRSNLDTLVHVRLGDYATNKSTKAHHGLLPEDYFINAISSFCAEEENIVLVTETPELLIGIYPRLSKMAAYIQANSCIEDLKLLASGRRLVMSNSSFSWWAAFLSSANVIAPRNWFSPEILSQRITKDLYLPTWEIM